MITERRALCRSDYACKHICGPFERTGVAQASRTRLARLPNTSYRRRPDRCRGTELSISNVHNIWGAGHHQGWTVHILYDISRRVRCNMLIASIRTTYSNLLPQLSPYSFSHFPSLPSSLPSLTILSLHLTLTIQSPSLPPSFPPFSLCISRSRPFAPPPRPPVCLPPPVFCLCLSSGSWYLSDRIFTSMES